MNNPPDPTPVPEPAPARRRRSLWPIVILALVAGLFGFGAGFIIAAGSNRQLANTQPQSVPVMRFLRENEPVPDFTLNTLDGRPVSLKKFRGRPVLINFWASWCPPCQQETSDLAAAYAAVKDLGVVFIGVGTQDETSRLKQFVADYRVPYLVVEDPSGDAGNAYRALGLPTTFLVDRDGNLRKAINGVIDRAQIIAEMTSLAQP